MIKSVGIVGAGQIGSGVAHVCALAGYEVIITDTSEKTIAKAIQDIDHNIDRQITRGHVDQKKKLTALTRLNPVKNLEAFETVGLVIEAATENEEIKRSILSKLCPILNPETYIVSSSSTIPITKLAAATDRPEKFMGAHFMYPVPIMELVELIRGITTSEETFNAIESLVVKLGKRPVNAEDFPGFIVNRILMPMINEAVYTLYEGVGTVEGIDLAMCLGANHPMGPLELADFIGIDTCLEIMQVLYEGLADSKYRPCPLLVRYVEAGWLGRKTGRGFYDYRNNPPVPTR